MEIESWVMADREGFAKFISISLDHMPQRMDDLEDPKNLKTDLPAPMKPAGLEIP